MSYLPKGPLPMARPTPGLYFPPFAIQLHSNTQTLAVGALRATRTVLPCAVDSIKVDVTTGAMDVLARVGWYLDVDGVPTTLQAQFADIDCNTTGVKTASISLPQGPVWLAIQNMSTGGAPAFRAQHGFNPYLPGVNGLTLSTTQVSCWDCASQGQVMPTTFPLAAVASGSTNHIPLIMLRAA